MPTCKVVDKYLFCLSTRKNKKYDVYDLNTSKYIVSFGDIRYEHYFDKIGLLPKKLNHKDLTRRKLYYDRHGKKASPDSARFFAHKYLW